MNSDIVKLNLDSIIELHNSFSKDIKLFEASFEIESPIISGNYNVGFFNNDLRYALRASIDLLDGYKNLQKKVKLINLESDEYKQELIYSQEKTKNSQFYLKISILISIISIVTTVILAL